MPCMILLYAVTVLSNTYFAYVGYPNTVHRHNTMYICYINTHVFYYACLIYCYYHYAFHQTFLFKKLERNKNLKEIKKLERNNLKEINLKEINLERKKEIK